VTKRLEREAADARNRRSPTRRSYASVFVFENSAECFLSIEGYMKWNGASEAQKTVLEVCGGVKKIWDIYMAFWDIFLNLSIIKALAITKGLTCFVTLAVRREEHTVATCICLKSTGRSAEIYEHSFESRAAVGSSMDHKV
jgi:hypothetical protein